MKSHPLEKLEKLLRGKPFAELLSEGIILDVKRVMEMTGYTRQHISKMCLEGKLPHFSRAEGLYFFFPEDIKALFSYSPAKR